MHIEGGMHRNIYAYAYIGEGICIYRIGDRGYGRVGKGRAYAYTREGIGI